MTKQECVETMDVALKYLGWQGGTVWQIEMELYKRTGIVRTTAIHAYIRGMLIGVKCSMIIENKLHATSDGHIK